MMGLAGVIKQPESATAQAVVAFQSLLTVVADPEQYREAMNKLLEEQEAARAAASLAEQRQSVLEDSLRDAGDTLERAAEAKAAMDRQRGSIDTHIADLSRREDRLKADMAALAEAESKLKEKIEADSAAFANREAELDAREAAMADAEAEAKGRLEQLEARAARLRAALENVDG